jgi:hypothetical protein
MATFSSEWKEALGRGRCPNGHVAHLEYDKGTGSQIKVSYLDRQKAGLRSVISIGAFANSYAGLYAKVRGGPGFYPNTYREDSSFRCNKCAGSWPVFSDMGQIVILGSMNTRRTFTPMGDVDYERNNRQSSIPMTSTIRVSRRWLQRLEVDWEKSGTTSTAGKASLSSKYAGIDIERKVEQSLKSSLSLSAETEQLTEQSLEVTVPAHRRLIVRLHWKQIWEEGDLGVRLPDGTSAQIPYRAAVDVAFDQENIEG